MKKLQKLFRTKLFGGYHKTDVARYVRRLEEELKARDQKLEDCEDQNRRNKELIEEAIHDIQRLRKENERLRRENERRE